MIRTESCISKVSVMLIDHMAILLTRDDPLTEFAVLTRNHRKMDAHSRLSTD